ncbi:MAG: asparagine synthase-related protein, partial [Candidatus Binatia bacterium]
MSAIAAVVALAERPIPRGLAASLGRSLSHHGSARVLHDGIDGVVLELGSERVSDAGRPGRSTLTALDAPLASSPDALAEVLARACGVGTERLSTVMPDECAAFVWERETRTAHLLRDPFGVRPLYWATSPDQWLVVASELQAILRTGLISFVPDWQCLHDLVTRNFAHWHRVPLTSIRAVSPGSRVRITRTGGSEERYWSFEPLPIRRRRLRDYEAEFRELLATAVRRRLSRRSSCAIYLSGGLDSSSITATAGAVLRGGLEVDVGAFHASFEDAEAAEARWARLAAGALGARVEEVPQRRASRLAEAQDEIRFHLHPIVDSIGHVTRSIARAFRAKGYGWALHGYPADDMLNGGVDSLDATLAGLRPGALVRVALRLGTLRSVAR